MNFIVEIKTYLAIYEISKKDTLSQCYPLDFLGFLLITKSHLCFKIKLIDKFLNIF